MNPLFSICSSTNSQMGRICVYSYKSDFSHSIDDIDDVDGISYRRRGRRKTLQRLGVTQTSQLLSPRFKTPRGTRLRQLRVRMEEKNVKRGKACWGNFQVVHEEKRQGRIMRNGTQTLMLLQSKIFFQAPF